MEHAPAETPQDQGLWRVGPELAGTRLDKALASLGTGLSRSRIQALIQAGEVSVDGRRRAIRA